MKNNRRFSGFTLAEVLIVVAITVVLAGVGFVSVFNHMRSLVQLERDTIAKEIFVAAQNHLTTAESQGYLNLGSAQYGLPETIGGGTESQDETGVYYLVIPADLGTYRMFELMLPFGAVDETVRAGGSYIIRYQPAAARILDVFYCARTGRFVLEGGFEDGDYDKLMTECYGEEKKSERKNYNGAVVGWYGGEASVEVGERLNVPTIEIINAERLQVKVTDNNSTDNNSGVNYASLKLIIEGVESGAKKAILVTDGGERVVEKDGSTYTITLDDITNKGANFHFCELDADTQDKSFLPGENIKVYAIAFSSTKLTNVAKSMEGNTNSLFGYDKTAKDHSIALISNIRHLENLDSEVSTFKGVIETSNTEDSQDEETVNTTQTAKALQTTDLVWTSFLEKVKEGGSTESNPSISYFVSGDKSEIAHTNAETYKPVTPDSEYTLQYNGNNHSISEVKVDYAGDAGIFGSLTGGSVTALLVRDSNISGHEDSTGNAGNAGGLIGSMTGTTVERCAANGTVTSDGESGAAGGLIGSASEGKVTACYSAGHTAEGSYEKWIEGKDEDNNPHGCDVTGAKAGGLIGVSSATIRNSYSTCSVSGTSFAGGFVGKADGGSITNCYAVGMVATKPVTVKDDHSQNSQIGAFAGNLTDVTLSGGQYFGIINEVKRTETKDGKEVKVFDHYLGAVGDADNNKITEIDQNAGSYESFVGAPDTWTKAEPHDNILSQYYGGKYNLKGISRLDTSLDQESIVATHYGDWPAPEIFVINTGTGNGNAGNGNGGAGG